MAEPNNSLAINTLPSAAPVEDEETATKLPLSPSSVRSYQKKKAGLTDKKVFSEDETETEDEDVASSGSDKKSEDDEDEDSYDAAHLDPRLEALDGTTRLKADKDKEAEQEDDDEDEDQEDSNEDDTDAAGSSSVANGIKDLQLTDIGSEAVSGNATSSAQQPTSLATPGLVLNGDTDINEGELYQDPTSDTVGSGSISSISTNQGQEERLQEPVRPHIALPCLVETARNPARTRITLRYTGIEHSSSVSVKSDRDLKTSTRGHKNYMVATDLSGESWHATEWAITTMLRNGDELNVVTIVEDDKTDPGKGVKKGVQTEMREDAEKLTKNIHEQLEHTNLRDITVVIHIIAATKSMGAKELLIEMIDDLDDLSTVIVGSRGRGAIKGLLLGSISNFLVHNSSVPVMVVRSPKKSRGKKKVRRGRMVEQSRSVREANLKYEQAFAEDDA